MESNSFHNFFIIKITKKQYVISKLYKNLTRRIGSDLLLEKRMVKSVFKVKFAKELRQFDKEKWIDAITTHLTPFKSQTPPNTH